MTRPHEDAALAAAAAQQPACLAHRLAAALSRAAASLRWAALLRRVQTGECAAVSGAQGVRSVVQIGPRPGDYSANVTAAPGAQR